MAGSMQDALADVALRLETLRAAVAQSDQAGGRDAQHLGAIKLLTSELEALLHPQEQQGAPAVANVAQALADAAPAAEPTHRATAPRVGPTAAVLPTTPFEQRRAPASAAKVPLVTPGGGVPATTPLAAEVLASLNAILLGDGDSSRAQATASPAPAPVDKADGDAASTLSGLFNGLDPRPLRAAPKQQRQQKPVAAALASLLQDTQLLPSALPMHAAAMAAAAAAGPALPASRRQSAAGLLMPLPVAAPRDQRPCNCKRSMCLKMYCECFAAGGFCAATCSCLSCSNRPTQLRAVTAAREQVLAKNPSAFEVKVTAAAGHRRGCRCKRSKCLKKYCECFHAGARCNPEVCQCEECHNTEGDEMLLPALNRRSHQAQPAPWVDATPNVLAMFQQQLDSLPMATAGSGGGSQSSGSEGCGPRGARRTKVSALQLHLLPEASVPYSFALPPMPLAEAGGSDGLMGSFSAAAMFAAVQPPAYDDATAAFMATMAAALAEQEMEESMADAASGPAPAAGTALAAAQRPATTPGAAKIVSALTSHLSDVAGASADPEVYDTATSPAPHMLVKMAAQRDLAPGMAPAKLTSGAPAGGKCRPPLPGSRVRSRAGSPLSVGSADENGSHNVPGVQRSKRPRRAASGGVLGAVAAEAADWGCDVLSPPLKRSNSLPVNVDASKRVGKVSDRIALLKRALVAETAAAQHKLMGGTFCGSDPGSPSAEDADAVSALFELSSMC